ncbi:hypothetical protein PPSIR1_29830 [Plesiocystis pacifica SIR-1]|uniref:Uncharacterized protein n=1 Tax=Plesiocystis pacifica SIR-1 TaxID=391625 RepID=A6FYU5_9BACT|nr:hypothetical protein PPSIR1_29830 [Plesiocystis pacifica SIR-1]
MAQGHGAVEERGLAGPGRAQSALSCPAALPGPGEASGYAGALAGGVGQGERGPVQV